MNPIAPMTNPSRLKLLIPLSLACLALAPVARAAENVERPNDSTLVTLNFPGGTLEEFVQALETASEGPVNLVMPGYGNVPVPAIRVTQVNLAQVFGAITNADPRIRFQPASRDTSSTVWAVQLADHRTTQQIARSFSVERLLEKYSINDITTAIKTAWDMMREADGASLPSSSRYWIEVAPPPELRFHQETQLLIIRGTPDDLNQATNVIEQLSPPRNTESPAARSPEEIAAIQKIKTDLEVERQQTLVKLQQAKSANSRNPDPFYENQISSLERDLQQVEQKIRNIEAVAANPPN